MSRRAKWTLGLTIIVVVGGGFLALSGAKKGSRATEVKLEPVGVVRELPEPGEAILLGDGRGRQGKDNTRDSRAYEPLPATDSLTLPPPYDQHTTPHTTDIYGAADPGGIAANPLDASDAGLTLKPG